MAYLQPDEEVEGAWTDDSAFDLDLAKKESIAWIEAVLQEKFGPNEDFHSGLREGVRLCRFINCIKPGAVKKINKMKVAFACMENITWFLDACRTIGLKDTQLFTSSDLYAGHEAGISSNQEEAALAAKKDVERKLRDVCITLYWLGRAVRAMPDYSGPQLNLAAFVKMTCSKCQLPITDNNYVVAGSRQFHAACFTCGTCGKDVDTAEDYVWDFITDKLNCACCRCVTCRDPVRPDTYRALDTRSLQQCDKICPKCDAANQCKTCRDVLVPETTTVHGSHKFCPKCVCADEECKKPFVNNKFSDIDGKRYCPDCLCHNCEALAGPDHVKKGPHKYCPQCYCADEECKKPFVDNKFSDIDGKRYCPDCLCHNCEALAGPDHVKQGPHKYCPQCYCADAKCKKPFVNNEFKEVDGKRYCPDCMCHREGCDRYAGENPVVVDGKKYCPHCVCADEDCRNPLIDGQYVDVPATGDFAGGPVCKSCLCGLCETFVGKHAYLRRRGVRFCKACCCGACRLPLHSRAGATTPTTNNPDARAFCANCVCTGCGAALQRRDTRVKYSGGQYCSACVCTLCTRPISGPRANDAVPYKDGRACVACQCDACHSPLPARERVAHGAGSFCRACVCTGCDKPATEVRGHLQDVGGKMLCSGCMCHTCAQPLPKDAVEYGDFRYCRKCVCATCNSPVPEGTGTAKGPRMYCASCVCVQCEDVLLPAKARTFGDLHVCATCACAICGRPEKPRGREPEAPFVKANGRRYCSSCVCFTCDTPLKENEDVYCTNCICNSCGCVLDEGEDKVCDMCGEGRPGHRTREQRRADKKNALAAAKAKDFPSSKAKEPAHTAAAAAPHVHGSNCDHDHGHEASPSAAAAPKKGKAAGACAKCSGDLFGSVVNALDKQWHADCFSCAGCDGNLKGGFAAHEGKPFCKACIGKAAGLPDCRGCGTSVSGSYFSFGDDLAWHSKCFKCSTCMKVLDPNTPDFRMNGSNVLCKSC